MRPIEKLIYTGITPDRMNLMRTQAKAQGLDLGGAKGNQNWDGCAIAYEYDEKAQTLTFTGAAPFNVSDNEIEGAINAIVRRNAPSYSPAGVPVAGSRY